VRRLLLVNYTGATAANLAIAQRIVRKIHGARRQRECLLIDCEEVEVSQDFLKVLVSAAHPEKIRFCGLPLIQQQFVQLKLQRRKS